MVNIAFISPPESCCHALCRWMKLNAWCSFRLQGMMCWQSPRQWSCCRCRRLSPPPVRFLLRQGQPYPTGGSDIPQIVLAISAHSIFSPFSWKALHAFVAGPASPQHRKNGVPRSAIYAHLISDAHKTSIFKNSLCTFFVIMFFLLSMLQSYHFLLGKPYSKHC